MIISPTLMWTFMQAMPDIALAIDPKNTKAKALKAVFKTIGTLTEGSKSSSIGTPTDPSPTPDSPNPTPGTDPSPIPDSPNPTPGRDTGLTIGPGKYNSPIPGVQGFGKGKPIFDPNYNTQQLRIQHPYNNTPDYSDFLRG